MFGNPSRAQLAATVQAQAERLVQVEAELATYQSQPVTELKRALIRTHEDREQAWQQVARLEQQLKSTQRQLDDALGYSAGDQRAIAAHSTPFETGP